MSFLTPVWSYVDALVHPAAQQDALTIARHRAFIAPRLLGSLVAIAGLPVYIAIRGDADDARSRDFLLVRGSDPDCLLPVAHWPV